METALTTKVLVHILLCLQNLAFEFVKFSVSTVTDISQRTEYFLVISTEPDLKLAQHLVEGRIVSVN